MPDPQADSAATEDAPRRSRWRRWRTAAVMLPLMAGLVIAGGRGAQLLWESTPDRSTEPVDVCWNDVEAPSGTCTLPTGTAGLAYVFPGFDEHQPDCRQRTFADPSSGATEWRCEMLVGGRTVEIGYRMRPTGKSGLGFLRRTYLGTPEETSLDGARAIWRPESPDGRGQYVFATSYFDYPYTFTLWAPSPQVRDEAVAKYAKFRPGREITGVRKRG